MQQQILTSAVAMDGTLIDVVVDGEGRIAAVGSGVTAGPGAAHIDLDGWLLLPAAREPHAHLDKAFLAEVVHNPTGDLIGAIDAMRRSRHLLTVAETVVRAERAARLMAANGYTAVRTHADLTIEHGLTSIEALTEVRARLSDVIDVEIVALCGWPVSGPGGADQRTLLRAGMDAGADLVGGVPHLETLEGGGTIEDATEFLLAVADEYRRPVDLHTDETLDPTVNGLDILADHVLSGFDLPVTASHCVSLGQRTPTEQGRTAERVGEAGINVVALPHTNLFLQGRGHTPMPRALTAVATLRSAGVNVAAGADNLQDPFNPLGRACPFETAGLMMLTTHLSANDAWSMVSLASDRVLGGHRLPVPSHGLRVGERADFLAVRAETLREAIAFAPRRRRVWRAGQERSET